MSFRHREKRDEFSGGLNTRDTNSTLQKTESPDMKNVLPGKRGGFAPRPGTRVAFSKPVCEERQEDDTFYPVTSLFEVAKEGGERHFLAFAYDQLKRATADGWQLVKAGFTKNTYFEFIYHPIVDKILFVNGADGYWETDGFEANKVPFYATQTYGNIGEPDYVDEDVEIGSSVIPPRPRYISYFDHRVWFANVQGFEDRVYFNVDDIYGNTHYNYFTPTSWIRVPTLRGEPITALQPYRDIQLVFTATSIKAIIKADPIQVEGMIYTPPAYALEDVSTTVGAVSNRSVQVIGGRVIFLGIDGVYLFDGTSAPYRISGRIDPTLDQIDKEARHRACAAFWYDKYFLSVPNK